MTRAETALTLAAARAATFAADLTETLAARAAAGALGEYTARIADALTREAFDLTAEALALAEKADRPETAPAIVTAAGDLADRADALAADLDAETGLAFDAETLADAFATVAARALAVADARREA